MLSVGRRARLLGFACFVASVVAGAAPDASAQTQTIDLVGVTSATFEWAAASGPVSAYLVYVAHDGQDFLSYPEGFTAPDSRRVTLHGKVGERLRVRVAAMGTSLAVGPYSPPSDQVRFVAGATGSAPYDFVGDGTSQLVLQDPFSSALTAYSAAPTPALDAFSSGSTVNAAWQIADAGDYDGDGRTDLLWRQPAANRYLLCRSDGRNTTRCADYVTLPAGWSLVGVGDTNGDGLRDVVLRGQRGSTHVVCLGQGTSLGACGPSFGPYDDAVWNVVAPGDVNGDQRADLLLYHVPSGLVLACPVVGSTVASCTTVITLGAGYTLVGIGDATGDGQGDIAMRDPAGSTLLVCSLANAQLQTCAGLTGITARWQLIGAGDYDGDRRADLVLRDTTAGLVRIDFLSGLARKGNPLFVPVGASLRVYARR